MRFFRSDSDYDLTGNDTQADLNSAVVPLDDFAPSDGSRRCDEHIGQSNVFDDIPD
jgi:hypothetical protein